MIVLSAKEEPKTKAEAFGLGANDYLVKLPDRIELLARIRYHSKGYINLLQRNEAYRPSGQPEAARQGRRAGGQVCASLLPEQAPRRARPDRLAVHSLRRTWRRHVRLPLARRRPLRVLPARRQRPRRRPGVAVGLGPECLAVAVAAADRLPRARPGSRGAEPGVPDGAAERPLLHDLVRGLHTRTRAGSTTPEEAIPRPCCGPAPRLAQSRTVVLESQGRSSASTPTWSSPRRAARSKPTGRS